MNRKIPVTAFMTTEVIALHPEDSLNIVEKTFEGHSFHHIPILDTDQNIQGIVSKSDLLQIAAIRRDFTESEFSRIKVKDFMTRIVVTVTPNSTLSDVADIFRANRFHAVPVVDDGKVVGIVTTHDVITAAFETELAS